MLQRLIKKVVRDSDQREIARWQKTVARINELEPAFMALDAEELRAKTDEFRQRLAQGETLDDILVEAFAAVREASRRAIGLRHYDVQLLGGILLHRGRIAEMKTGEGKTLVATLPLYLNALAGRGVHLVTVNDYLARRDGGWMGPVFHLLGMSVGLVIPRASGIYDPAYIDPNSALEDGRLVHWRPVSRKEAYLADVTYGTNNEFGFDYLRDNMARSLDECVQRELYYGIVDEVDNVLIDEARTPLIISGPAEESSELYARFAQIVPRLRPSSPESIERKEPDGDYVVEERTQIVTLTDRGIERVEKMLPELQGGSIYDPQHAYMLPYLDNALRAHVIYKRDKDYIVRDGEVIIVDEFTGRLMFGRRFSEGLHQAIEAKEGVAVRRESLTYATITFQNYFRMYKKLAGMTGTAKTEEEEFQKIYNLDVVVLPTHVEYRAACGDLVARERRVDELQGVTFAGLFNGRTDELALPDRPPVVTTYESTDGDQTVYFKRLDLSDLIYATEAAKFEAVVDEIAALHEAGRPVLVGTIAIETSERLARLLERRRIPHQVLNGKLHEKEASVIAQAGRPGAVTIATNMAGRGVDIILGGNPEGLASKLLEQRFRKTAEEFVQALLDGRREEALKMVEGAAGFSPDSLALADKLRAEYEVYESAAAQERLPRFIADRLVDEGVIDRRFHGPVMSIADLVIQEEWAAALDGSRLPEGLSERIVGEIQRIRAQYEMPGSKTAYIAGGLFNHYYMAMAALIRAVLQGDQEQAARLIREYPELNERLVEEITRIKEQCEQDGRRVRALGGLHVIGTERHEARRIDNQLRGRAGRQGDPGSSRFYISLEDELMRRFGGERVREMMARFGVEEDVPLRHSWLDKTIESAQMRVEGYNFDIRKHVLEYDDVVNKQRESFYGQRRQVLAASDLRDQVLRMVKEEISALVAAHMPGFEPDDWDLDGLLKELRLFLPLPADWRPGRWESMTPAKVEEELSRLAESQYDEMNRRLAAALFDRLQKEDVTLEGMSRSADPLQRQVYERARDRLGTALSPESLAEPLRKLPPSARQEIEAVFADCFRVHRDRQLILSVADRLWVRHLTDLEALREGIGLRAYGQQNPLVAYRKEAYEMYEALLGAIQQTVARSVYLVPRETNQSARSQHRRQQPIRSAAPAERAELRTRAGSKQSLGRNDPCWCGSGVKYKNCHMRLDQEGVHAGRLPAGKKRR